MAVVDALADLNARLVGCRRCPRLVAWREQVAVQRRAAFAAEEYWGRPVPGFGDREAGLLVVGLAPAAHGANRTGRMFTGDRSGDWLYRALHRAGFADRPQSRHRDDGLQLRGAYITAPVRCAPPGNRPTGEERAACRPWLREEFGTLAGVELIVCLGGVAYEEVWRLLAWAGAALPRPRPAFAHGLVAETGGPTVLCSFHPSQQNTFTGRLTEEMLDEAFAAARARLGGALGYGKRRA
ncbi:MAG: uracil-DNA glycosylase [Acidimicrobiia bacterium]|nr:uracil-DNA glycosylase [Acidimicrobiia bacterium]